MLTFRGLDLRVGARLLLSGATAHVAPGDRIGLVGRNGAGKTTLMKTLAGRLQPAAGDIVRTGSVGYLPQDPAAADPGRAVLDRVLSARGLDVALRDLRAAETALAESGDERSMSRYARAEAEFQARGGYAAEAAAARVAAGLGLPDRALDQPLGNLSGGQRRRVELARVLFAEPEVMLLDEPTNHLDGDSVAWLRSFLLGHPGGLVLISHDTGLLADVANRVWHVEDGALEVHNTGWRTYLADRDADDRRRARLRAAAERKAAALHAQADRMRSRASTAVRARDMARRADRMLAGTRPVRRTGKVARIRLPEPAPSGRMPLGAISLTKSYGGLPVLTGVDLAIDRGSRLVVLGLNGAGKTTLLRLLAGHERPDSGRVVPGHGLRLGYFAQEHDTLDPATTVGGHLAAAAPQLTDGEARAVLGSFLFGGDDVDKPVGVLSGGEKTRLALAGLVSSRANVLLLDEPTNNLDPASKAEVLAAVEAYEGAMVMVTHDQEAVEALRPERVLLLPDGVEDLWHDGYADLVTLA
ncbi:ABC-F family ATP-binding cassette domain-containing protein [Nonomuraea gerenzanensis]|uniref:ABC transporter ATP-binding protein n=1 Tax=Nonomuraea gerenzanensis TaxID=93944 RepID=A0A1M4E558_9ACTN|nr:ABC-F family ATP-binding cassette domain-containing protein [Nonomuraea gerenzanensis]UBU16184.1 ATP-binding cassette domain-containing protein [Nonomuraea gerenzanensis]SBO93995.1 ABC transporter ATP-binding protein [Nonomuraea gerenzanensis]